MSENIYAGLTSQTIDIVLADSSSTTGAGLSGLVFNSSGLKAYYRKGATGTATAITLATQTVGGAWSSGGFVEIDATNMKGAYRLDVPDAAFASSGFVTLCIFGATNLVPTFQRIDCRPMPADIKQALTNAVTTTANGILDVNVKNYNNQTAQTDANNLPKVDTEDVAGTATTNLLLSKGTAQAGSGIGSTTFQLAASPAWGTDNILKGFTLVTTGGAGANQKRTITGLTASTGVITTDWGWLVLTDNTTTYEIWKTPSLRANSSVNLDTVNTATFLTNAPTAGDFNATMKTTLNALSNAFSGTSTAGSGTTITLQTALGADSLPNGELIKITSGTGAGQTRGIVGYVDSTKVLTVDRAWITNPDATSVYAIMYASEAKLDTSEQVTAASVQGNVTGSVASVTAGVTVTTNNDKTGYTLTVTPPTSAAIATAVWQDTTAGDFTTAGSIGKSLFTSGNAPGAASGIAIVGSNMGSVTSVSGSVASVTAGVTVATNNDKTGYFLTVTPPTSTAIATAVWQDATAGDFTTASSIGKSLYTTGNAPGAANGIALVGSNVGIATSVSGAVGSVTGNVGGNVVGSVASVTSGVDLVNAPNATALAAIADATLDRTAGVETGRTLRQSLRLMLAALVGKISGASGTTVSIRDTNDTKNRIVATVDTDGDRTSVTLDQS